MIKLHQGDCLEIMKTMPDNSVSSIVTDPPYGLKFMSKKWDYDVPSVEIWKEALRVLKPGGVALIFAGSRTQHRMAVNVEDAGFFIRDTIMWIYGSGFPKSQDISKQIDKKAGAKREVVGKNPHHRPSHLDSNNKWRQKECREASPITSPNITTPATPAAKLWNGYGTALKPAYEPIIVAMKPNDGTFVNNALKHGVAGINIDGCRVDTRGDKTNERSCTRKRSTVALPGVRGTVEQEGFAYHNSGRFPANIIHDGSEEVTTGMGDSARFFYCAKASKKERGEGNVHPTVKPLALARYLIKLVKMPENTIILDCFMGSGTFGEASELEGVDFIGIEKDPEYFKIAEDRINSVDKND